MSRQAAIELQHVWKAFGDRTILEDLSLRVPSGSAYCILGRSGTGKSVVLKHIIGLIKPDRGAVLVEDRDVAALDQRGVTEVRKRIGFLFQNAALFDSLSVGENVAFPIRRHARWPEDRIRSVVLEKLAQVGLEREYDKMPSELSGGMRKRAGLARAMVLEPPLLLVDEPSSGLDPVTSDEIDKLLFRQKEDSGVTLVVVTHNIVSAKKIADRLAFLHEGRLVAEGTVAELENSSHDMVRRFLAFEGKGN